MLETMLRGHNNSVYCAKFDNTIDSENSLFQRKAYDFSAEAAALGSSIQTTASGFYDVIPFIKSPEQLSSIPRLSESQQIKNNLTHIKELSKEKPYMANATAPYSLLAMITSAQLMTWLVRYPNEILSALNSLVQELAWYISELFIAGAKVVSLSDPHAQRELIGDSRYVKFCLESQMALLKQILKFKAKGVLHLCPYCFIPLEDYKFLHAKENKTADKSYEQALVTAANTAGEIVLVGRQCPHTKQTDFIYFYTLTGEPVEVSF